jgi:hypothetical protein
MRRYWHHNGTLIGVNDLALRVEQTFRVARRPAVSDYMTDPANLAAWQTSTTRVEPETDGPARQGYRVREWTKPPGGREF